MQEQELSTATSYQLVKQPSTSHSKAVEIFGGYLHPLLESTLAELRCSLSHPPCAQKGSASPPNTNGHVVSSGACHPQAGFSPDRDAFSTLSYSGVFFSDIFPKRFCSQEAGS